MGSIHDIRTLDNYKLTEFPEEVTVDGIKIYGEASYGNQMAELSHFLHNHPDDISQEQKEHIILAIREYLSEKAIKQGYIDKDMSDEGLWKLTEDAAQYSLFADFFNVPFPSPKIGGIRIPFDEMGYQCVFSSEWDAKACQTYLANFDCQFVMSTHSPFILSIPFARIYNMDETPVSTCKWTELPSVRLYHDFFKDHAEEFN